MPVLTILPFTPPPSGSTVVVIGGTTMNVPRDIVLERVMIYSRGGVPTASFSVRGGALPGEPDPYRSKSMTVTISGTLIFSGRIMSVHPEYHDGQLGWLRPYQAIGSRDFGDWVSHTDSNNGSDTSAYNLSADNQGPDYLASRAGRTVGQILADVLTMPANAAALDAYGLGGYTGLPTTPTLPAAILADLAALTMIPPAPVYVSGEKLLAALESVLGQWSPNHVFNVEPDGTFRIRDLRAFTAHTLTMNADPIEPVAIASDTSRCASRIVIRGAGIAEMFQFSTANGGLSEAPFAHDGLTIAQAKAAWTQSDFYSSSLPPGQAFAVASLTGSGVGGVAVSLAGYGYSSAPPVSFSGGGGSGATATAAISGGQVTGVTIGAAGSGYTTPPKVSIGAPGGASSDGGSCTCPSTTTVTITSGNPAYRWVANYWDQTATGKHGTMFLSYSLGTTITTYAVRGVVANGALAPGGTCTITLDRPLPHLNFDSYVLRGNANTASAVWTTYQLPAWAGPKIAKQSTAAIPYTLSNGTFVSLTSSALGLVVWGSPPAYNEIAESLAIDPAAGTVRFGFPTYLLAGNQAPVEVRALVPIYTGVNQVASPADIAGVPQYSGTYKTVDGQSRTLLVSIPAWRDPANTTGMQALADDMHEAYGPITYEGTVRFYGLYTLAFTMGISLNIAGNGYVTGWESTSIPALPVGECEILWPLRGPTQHVTIMKVSNRRGHLNAEAFLRPDRVGLTWDGSVSGLGDSPPPLPPQPGGELPYVRLEDL